MSDLPSVAQDDVFRALFELSPVPTVIMRIADGHILMANPACLALLGWSADELIGRTAAEIRIWAHPESRDVMVERIRSEGRIRNLEDDLRTKDGRILRMLASIEPVTYDGTPCLLGTFIDISDRAALEVALREARTLLDRAPVAVATRDRDGRYLLANPALEAFVGLPPAQVLGKRVTEAVTPEVAERIISTDREVFASGEPLQVVMEIPQPSGAPKTYIVDKFPLRDDDGAIYAVGAVATDVTEQVRIQAEIRAARDQAEQTARELAKANAEIRDLYDHAPVGYHSVDADGTFVHVNQTELSWLGYTAEELIGKKRFTDLLTPASREVTAVTFPEFKRSGVLHDLELEFVRKDGTILPVAVSASAVRDEAGRFLMTRSTLVDITARSRAEAEREAARQEAERANLAKSEFLSRMSHELRTPLHAILGFAELLRMEDLTAEQHEAARQIDQSGRVLLALVNDVLDIARIESGPVALSPEPVPVAEVIGEALQMIAPLARARRIRQPRRPPRCAHHVLADRQRLAHVVVNLLSNAVKYGHEGGRVTVACRRRSGRRLRIAVTDTGIGIAEADMGRLFRPFERLAGEHSEADGSGIGLALSKELVERMGGTIGVTSQVGRGSSFWVEFPLVETPAASAVAPPPTAAATAGLPFSGTVLAIEDNLSNIALLQRILAHRPRARLLTAVQGSLGLDLAWQHRPDVVLLDLHLPDMSGQEVLERLRTDGRTAALPIIVVSADATSGQRDRLRAAGATDYLAKPLEVGRLLDMLDGLAEPGHVMPTGPSSDAVAAAKDVASAGDHALQGREEVLDPDRLAELRALDDGDDAVASLAALFLKEAPGRLRRFERAAAARYVVGVVEAAHGLRGLAATFGAHRLARAAGAAQAAARAGRVPDRKARRELRAALDEAADALRRLTQVAGAPTGAPSAPGRPGSRRTPPA